MYQTLVKWREPKDATRWRDAREAARRRPWVPLARGVCYTALLVALWWLSPNPAQPSREFVLWSSPVAGFALAFGTPALVGLAPLVVWVRNYGIHCARANTATIFKFDNAACYRIGPVPQAPAVTFLTVEMRDGAVRHIGVGPEVNLQDLASTLERHGVAVVT